MSTLVANPLFNSLHAIYDNWSNTWPVYIGPIPATDGSGQVVTTLIYTESPCDVTFNALLAACVSNDNGPTGPGMEFIVHKLEADPMYNYPALDVYDMMQTNTSLTITRSNTLSEIDRAIRTVNLYRTQYPLPNSSITPSVCGTKVIGIAGSTFKNCADISAAVVQQLQNLKYQIYQLSTKTYARIFCSRFLENMPNRFGAISIFNTQPNAPIPASISWASTGTVVAATPFSKAALTLRMSSLVNGTAISNHIITNLQTAVTVADAVAKSVSNTVPLASNTILDIVYNVFRDIAGLDFWLYQAQQESFSMCATCVGVIMVIDDLVYQNECNWVKNNPGSLILLMPEAEFDNDGLIANPISEESASIVLTDNGVFSDYMTLLNQNMQSLIGFLGTSSSQIITK